VFDASELVITHADGCRGIGFSAAFVYVCLSIYPHDISKTDAVRITKLDAQMLQDKSWIPIYFGFKRSKVKVTSHKNIAGVSLCTLENAGF